MHSIRRTFAGMTLAAAGALLLTACLDTPTEFECSAVVNQQASVRADSVVTTSGLIYRETQVGTGAQVQSTDDCQLVQVRYVGRLQDGTVFTQTPGTQVYAFTVGRHLLIEGFEQGVVGMRVGGSRQLIIPPALGYGDVPQRDGAGNIVVPAGSTLIFDVTLVAVE